MSEADAGGTAVADAPKQDRRRGPRGPRVERTSAAAVAAKAEMESHRPGHDAYVKARTAGEKDAQEANRAEYTAFKRAYKQYLDAPATD